MTIKKIPPKKGESFPLIKNDSSDLPAASTGKPRPAVSYDDKQDKQDNKQDKPAAKSSEGHTYTP